MRLLAAVLCVGLGVIAPSGVTAQTPERSILLLVQSDPRGPFHADILSAFHGHIDQRAGHITTIYSEFLDRSRFNSTRYQQQLRQHFEEKYRDRPIGVIVALGNFSLELATALREKTFSNVPLVFGQIDRSVYQARSPAPNTTGSFIRLKLADMVGVAHIVVPDLKHLAIVGDRLSEQPAFLHFEDELPPIAKDFQIIDLSGLPMTELETRVASLPDATAIIYTAIYSDGRGTYYPPVIALKHLADKANRPIIGAISTYVGNGVVGGYMVSGGLIGEEAARLAMRVLNGERPSAIPVVEAPKLQPIFDWRELQRWKVNQAALPAGSEIRFHPPATNYLRVATIAIGAIAMIGFAAAVGYERWKRHVAERASRQRIAELAYVSRHAVAGEMSAAIAHELNQPLGSILNDVEAVELLLNSPSLDLEQLKLLIGDIRRSDHRASSIIRHLRTLMSKQTEQFLPVDLGRTAADAVELARIPANANGVVIHLTIPPNTYTVLGAPIQLQQVFLNLLMNGIDAVKSYPAGRRDVVISAWEAKSRFIEVSVSDSGSGISSDKLEHIFQPFFTTKENGMGMGLSLCQTIVEMHEGSIWAANGYNGGAIFRFTLPLQKTFEVVS